ncbi:Protein-tyrosine phosphatase-like [Arabidopsis thaliana x Arabidopsis arenosa]|uniref:Protein-tyrosine phosphatase-like n=2 Tax=Arabidopsis TaxID=3701 RepID=A0A8T2BHR3_ARASU|nr:Protein-tyrosine phosphatase-like [Arabidopsis thaliana x Arabidopsis arenosa]KAG7583411.1 Protein-tyrosine phosphatase-like [Arabidopsis suecica]
MRKRERENPCSICGHYHKYEEGEVCGICGHCMPVSSDTVAAQQVHVSAFPSEILPEFLYLGSYDNASRSELLKTQGISRVLNTVPMCQNLYRNSFTYHGLDNEKVLQFDDAIKFLDQCEKDKARVLVHCMSGKSRSPAVVIAYLMKRKGWRLAESHQWVKQRRPSTDISPEFYQQLQEFEQSIFGSGMMSAMNINDAPTFGFGFPKIDNQAQAPVFNNAPTSSIFSSPASSIPPQEFTFGATPTKPTTGGDIAMDGS